MERPLDWNVFMNSLDDLVKALSTGSYSSAPPGTDTTKLVFEGIPDIFFEEGGCFAKPKEDPKCECGGKACGYGRGPLHSSWCPWFKKDL